MPNILNAKLAIQENLPDGKVKADVTCQLAFSQFERFLMQNGLKFRLDCKLWGEDGGILDGDDDLFTYPSKTFPDATPSAIENISFSAVMKSSKLNEDDYWPNYGDEVYGGLRLKNLHDGTVLTKKTNVIEHRF